MCAQLALLPPFLRAPSQALLRRIALRQHPLRRLRRVAAAVAQTASGLLSRQAQIHQRCVRLGVHRKGLRVRLSSLQRGERGADIAA